MPAAIARPLLHTAHLFSFVALLATGLLLLLPELRASITGGYSLVIRQVHLWGGIAFALLPLAIILAFGPRAIFARPIAKGPIGLWKAAHLLLTFGMGGVFTVTGVAIWGREAISESLVDLSHSVHDGLTYPAALLATAHLLQIGLAAVLARTRAAPAASSRVKS